MTMHLQRDIEQLRKKILTLGTLVEEGTQHAMDALSGFDLNHITQLAAGEIVINEMEVEIEEDCLKILALHQPVATDLRFLIVVLKVNNELERIGDQAVNIGGRVSFLAEQPPIRVHIDFAKMVEVTRKMVRLALDSLVKQDVATARTVLAMDDEVDDIHAGMFTIVHEYVAAAPTESPVGYSYLTISSNLERIADLATNIAEEVIFMEEGEVVRHQ